MNAGGDVVLLYASKYHDIHTVVNVSGRYDLKKGIEERFGKDFMDRIQDGFVDIKNKKGNSFFAGRVPHSSLLFSNGNLFFLCSNEFHVSNILWTYIASSTTNRADSTLLLWLANYRFVPHWSRIWDFMSAGVEYRVTKESLMERLSLDMHEACRKIPRECRWDWIIFICIRLSWKKKIKWLHAGCWRSMDLPMK